MTRPSPAHVGNQLGDGSCAMCGVRLVGQFGQFGCVASWRVHFERCKCVLFGETAKLFCELVTHMGCVILYSRGCKDSVSSQPWWFSASRFRSTLCVSIPGNCVDCMSIVFCFCLSSVRNSLRTMLRIPRRALNRNNCELQYLPSGKQSGSTTCIAAHF